MFGILIALIQKLKKSKVDKIPGMGLSTNDFSDSYKNTLDSLTSTSIKLEVSEKILIEDNSISLPNICLGQPVFKLAQVYDEIDSLFMREYSCEYNKNSNKVDFNIEDELDGKFAILTYLTLDINEA
jgi:hypothetical protein